MRVCLPIGGVVSLAHIADHVFEVEASVAGTIERGRRFTVHAEAVHPVTRRPATGVKWEATLSVDGKKLDPQERREWPEGFVEWTFEAPVEGGEDEAEVEVTARRGDFVQSVTLDARVRAGLTGRIQTDKPIYQPGQTLHARAVVTSATGGAAAGSKVEVQIHGPDGERAHTMELEASKFGVVHDDWKIPETAALGTYEIRLWSVGGREREIARHVVRVSRYELPTFVVTVKPDRTAYLPGQKARVTITGTYLFGKPVAKGRVKVVREKAGRSEEAAGEAGADGSLGVELDLTGDHAGLGDLAYRRFEDVPFTVYYTDGMSGRTEQRRFDLRITREPIHVSVIRREGGRALPTTVYVVTVYADGRPAAAQVEVSWKGQSVRLETNRYGVGKVLLPGGAPAGDVVFRATDGAGLMGRWTETMGREGRRLVRLEAARTLHRAGEAVTLRIFADPAAGGGPVLVHAIVDGRRVATRAAQLAGGRGEVRFPYQEEFRRAVTFAVWSGAVRDTWEGEGSEELATVIFPDGADLILSVKPDRPVYRPKETASVRMQVTARDGKAVEAALGLAVVDQAVLERARTEDEFGRRRWFECGFCGEDEEELGGIRLKDLYGLQATAAVSAELDLVAEALAARVGAPVASQRSESMEARPAFGPVGVQARQMEESLERHYAQTLEFPDDISTLARVLQRQWTNAVDPWGTRYEAVFGVEGEYRTVVLRSAGPDKRFGTGDDFAAAVFRASYFAAARSLIERILREHGEYPATAGEFTDLLGQNGLVLKAMRDPWGTAYNAEVKTVAARRRIRIVSAGPDRIFQTADDVVVGVFSGRYFQRETAAMARALEAAERTPQTVDEFRAALSGAGIDLAAYRDAWGRPYQLTSEVRARYSDRIRFTTMRVYGRPPTTKTEVTPVTQRIVIFGLRSAGEDGVENSPDDFEIARIPFVVSEEPARAAGGGRGAGPGARAGTAAIRGIVKDPSGAVIPNAEVVLDDGLETRREAADGSGVFQFTALTAGMYSLTVLSPGFQMHRVSEIPAIAGQTTLVDVELEIGSVAQMVTVESPEAKLETQTAQAAGRSGSTPRVRDYFPETLVWLPEMVTGANGVASHRFVLADTVTSWKIAVFASAADGRIAEAESEVQAFLPFFVEFNPPPVLTAGDRIEMPVTIRNYQRQAEDVRVALTPNDWSKVGGELEKRVSVPANGAANVTYEVEARKVTERAAQRVVAAAGRSGDAIEKTLRVRPDGQEVTRIVGSVLAGTTTFPVTIPTQAIAGATRGEVRIYTSVAPLLLESAAGILSAPLGCAEQVTSAGYANLIAWRFARAAGIRNPAVEQRALPHVKAAVARIEELMQGDGGLSYWSTREADAAVTAHALSFLVAASAVTEVERPTMERLVTWLEGARTKTGWWQPRGGREDEGERQGVLTGLVARALAEAQRAGIPVTRRVLEEAYGHLARFTDGTGEPYQLANFILAALASGDEKLLQDEPARLAALGREEEGAVYWDARTNTPFYGWGTAGRHETTGLAVSALLAWRARHPGTPGLDAVIRRGLFFLLRGRDREGGWHSTQATLRAMSALADAAPLLGPGAGVGGTIEVRVNGRVVRKAVLAGDGKSLDPLVVDVSGLLTTGANKVALAPAGGVGFAVARLTTAHWLPWEQTRARTSEEVRYEVRFERLDGRAGEPVRCRVSAERVGFRGYGMLLAEVALAPGWKWTGRRWRRC